MPQKPKLLKCRCSPKGCTHWEVIVHPRQRATLKCVTCSEEHEILLDIPAHDNLHFEEHTK